MGVGIALCVATVGTTSAYELHCTVTDYGAAARHHGFKKFVPQTMIHVIDDDRAELVPIGLRGDVEERSNKVVITYFGELNGVGETEVNYVYFPSTGVMVAKTRGLKKIVWDQEFPERTGKYVVNGTCKKK